MRSQNMVHIAESTLGRKYAGWFIRNTEHAQRVFDSLRNSPLPIPPKAPTPASKPTQEPSPAAPRTGGRSVAWGGVKA